LFYLALGWRPVWTGSPSQLNAIRNGFLLDFAMAKTVFHPTDIHVGNRVRMRRKMLGMSQEKLGGALGVTFQQVQKYEKGRNRISASRLQQIAHILQVPMPFFFEGGPNAVGRPRRGEEAPSPSYISKFLATTDGLALVKGFTAIQDAKLRRKIVLMVRAIAGDK
jgi:transcriptional regulator with XRE-family HTH domain